MNFSILEGTANIWRDPPRPGLRLGHPSEEGMDCWTIGLGGFKKQHASKNPILRGDSSMHPKGCIGQGCVHARLQNLLPSPYTTSMRYCLLLLLLCGCTPPPPNIVIIFADDLGYADLGTYGATTFATPNIDGIAENGVRFTNFYVSSPVCSASRAALLTGSYHRRVGISGAFNPHSQRGLNSNETTIAELLKEQGYATAAIGKWHLGHHEPFLPTNHGFDSYFGIPYSNDMSPDPANNPRERARKWPPLPLVENLTTIEEEPDQSLITERYTEKAVDFIEANKKQPFFLYLAHTMPHVPLYTAPAFTGSSVQGAYGDVIQEIDWSTGQILKTLESLDLTDNTLVIFTSDNGPWRVFGNHGGECGNLRGRKGSVWECGIRVPFVAQWPGHIPAATIQDATAMTIDLLPTIAQRTGSALT